MPAYVYGDADSAPAFVPAGDYILQVFKIYKFGLSKQGNDKMDIIAKVEDKGTLLFETLTFSEEGHGRLDNFLKSCNAGVAKGEPVEFNREDVKEGGPRFVDIVGLRGWATLKVEEYPVGSGSRKNKVLVWLTDKPKLPRVVRAVPVAASTPADATPPEEDDVPF